jgi:hypothetical protein
LIDHRRKGATTMRRLKLIGAAALLSAAVATPVLAQEVETYVAPRGYVVAPAAPPTYYRGQPDPSMLPPRDNDEYWNLINRQDTGRSPSRPGGENPNFNPPS